MSYEGVIFDLDGTLLDSLPGIADAANSILAEMDYNTHPMESYRYFIGDGVIELIKRVLPADWQETGAAQREKDKERFLERMVTGYRAFYAELWPAGTQLYPGIVELLKALQLENIKLGILSNKSDDFTQVMAEYFLREYPFSVVRGARPGVPTKPAPDSALEIASLLNCHPQHMVFLGDSGVDMKTAQNAGMFPVGALWGYRNTAELVENGAQMLLHHPTELLSLL